DLRQRLLREDLRHPGRDPAVRLDQSGTILRLLLALEPPQTLLEVAARRGELGGRRRAHAPAARGGLGLVVVVALGTSLGLVVVALGAGVVLLVLVHRGERLARAGLGLLVGVVVVDDRL